MIPFLIRGNKNSRMEVICSWYLKTAVLVDKQQTGFFTIAAVAQESRLWI